MRILHFWISVERNTLLLLDENSLRLELFGLWSKKVFLKLNQNGHFQFGRSCLKVADVWLDQTVQ